jgi:alginate O-acetyltransferase complex protein AlgI
MTRNIRTKINALTGIERLPLLHSSLQKLITFSLVTVAWIFFRAHTIADAVYMTQRLPGVFGERAWSAIYTSSGHLNILAQSQTKMLVCVFVICAMELVNRIQKKGSLNTFLQNQPSYVRWGVYYALLFMIIYLAPAHNRQFIYFQF